MTKVTEWANNIFRVEDDIGKGGEEYASYLILGDDKIAIVDIPSRSIGKKIISFVKKNGRDLNDIKYLILTHTHPDHWAGLSALKKIQPQIVIHESGKPALTETKKFIFEKQFTSVSKFGLAMKSSLFSKIKKVDEDSIFTFTDSESIDLGGEQLLLQHTGGHSGDSILIQAYRGQCTFIGDEANIYPDQPASFYIDSTGSSSRRLKLINLLSNLNTEVICPAHQSPVPKPTDMYLNNLQFEHKHTKDTIYDLLVSAGQAKTFYLGEEYQKIIGISWKTPFKELGVAEMTAEAFLNEMKKEGIAEYESHTQRWSADV